VVMMLCFMPVHVYAFLVTSLRMQWLLFTACEFEVIFSFLTWRSCQTLYRQVDGMPATRDVGCTIASTRYLSLWLGLQHIGHDGVAARIQNSLNLVVNDCEILFLIFAFVSS